MHDINSRRLDHVVALSEEGSFAKAAVRVHLSQPALSRSIQSLEEEFGIRLFDRASRGVTLTPAGKLIVQRARRVLFEARSLERDVELLKTSEAGSLAIGVGPYCAEILLPGLLIEFAQRYPKLSVRIELSDGASLLEQLLDEEVDLVVTDQRGLHMNPRISMFRMPQHEAALYVRQGHPLLLRDRIMTADLRDYPFVSVPVPAFLHDAVRRVMKLRPNEEFSLQTQCNDISVLKALVRGTDAVMFATASTVLRETAEKVLVPLRPADGFAMALEFGLAHLVDRTLSPAAEMAVMMIRDAMLM